MDDLEAHSSGDDPVEDCDPPYDVPETPTQEGGLSGDDCEDSASLVSANSSIVSSPNERRPGLGPVKGLGWSGLSYDDYE